MPCWHPAKRPSLGTGDGLCCFLGHVLSTAFFLASLCSLLIDLALFFKYRLDKVIFLFKKKKSLDILHLDLLSFGNSDWNENCSYIGSLLLIPFNSEIL